MTSFDPSATEALTRSFILGTARHPAPVERVFKDGPAPDPSRSALTALALLGQRMRFRRHGPPPMIRPVTPIADSRTIVAEAARPLMRRLVGDTIQAENDIAALALADICHRRGLRPHPFDLPRLTAFVRCHGEHLGAGAAAWTARGEGADERPAESFNAASIDETNWTSARPAARADFIAALRARDPDHARALVETCFAAEPSTVRARLVEALTYGLSSADVPFLEGLAKDRAPSVREQAQRLLMRVPGAAMERRVGDFVARTQRLLSWLLRQHVVLSLELPAQLSRSFDATARRWAIDEYAGLGLDVMAAALTLPVTDMIAAARDDAPLTALFAHLATIERRFDLLAAIVRGGRPDAWIDAIAAQAGEGALIMQVGEAFDDWCSAALVPDLWAALPDPTIFEGLYAFLRRPLPSTQARELLRCRAFAAFPGENPIPGLVSRHCIAFAALTPAPVRAELRATLVALERDETARAVLLLDCLALLDPPDP